MSEYTPIVTPETTSPEEDTTDSKSKKKKKDLGSFIVEAKPQSILDKFTSKDSKSEKPTADPEKISKNSEAADTPESESVSNESLEAEETHEVVGQLAAARRQELTEADSSEVTDPEEVAAVESYLATTQEIGDIEAAYQRTVAEIESAEAEEAASEGYTIDPNQPGEGVIDLGVEDSSASQAPSPPRAAGSAAGGGGRSQPPRTPGTFPLNPNSGPNFSSPRATPTLEATVPLDLAANQSRRAQSEGLIIGGIVGYLVGRRRGRIKTEKRLVPIQKKLEKQVQGLQTELIATEMLVRQKVREQVVIAPSEKVLDDTVRQERQKLSSALPAERIGQVIVAANLRREVVPTKKNNRAESISARKQAESMSRPQLLSISEKIKVEGTTLRKIYETQLVSEKGLRRLVAEHLRGGNVTRTLKRELVEREIDFERDPILRDKDHGAGSDAAGKAALAAMLAKVGVSEKAETEPIGSASSAKKQKQFTEQTKKQSSSTDIVDMALVSIISFLILAIIVLLFRG